MKWMVLVVAVACACPSKQTAAPAGGSAAIDPGAPATCDAVRPKVEQLYRAEAQTKEPKRVDEATADNVAMVMADCAKDPKAAACLAKAATVADIEKQCLTPLDDEGTEGEKR